MDAAEARTRRAALALHALATDDRARVLAMLADAQRQRVEPMLSELQELGIPAGIAPSPPESANAGAACVQRLSALTVEQVAPALAALAPATVTALLRVHDWPWADALPRGAPGAHRFPAAAHVEASPRLAPRMAEALCESFEAAVRGGADGRATIARGLAHHRWWRRWMR